MAELAQGIGYPRQLMVDLFEFPAGPQRPPESDPTSAEVREVRGWTVRG